MNNLELASAYLDEAKMRIETARRALGEKAFGYCIRQAQEAVELSLKSALRLVGLEPPKWHDVGMILLDYRARFPEWFQHELEGIASTSRWLQREREPSMYGDEDLGLPPARIYTKSYAEKAFKEAEMVIDLVSKLVEASP